MPDTPRTISARIASNTRWHGDEHPRVVADRNELQTLAAETYMRRLLRAHPLSSTQRMRIATVVLAGLPADDPSTATVAG